MKGDGRRAVLCMQMIKTFERWASGRFTILLCLLLLAVLLIPLFDHEDLGRVIFNGLLTLVLIGSVQATAVHRHERIALWAIVAISVIVRWTGHVFGGAKLQMASDVLAASFLGLVAVVLLRYVLRAAHVDRDLLSAGLCVYLLIGLAFAMLYAALDCGDPAAFALPAERTVPVSAGSAGRVSDYVYFSVITMTTTGLGDIRPVSQMARSLTMAEILLGQLYLVVMISRLVTAWDRRPASKG